MSTIAEQLGEVAYQITQNGLSDELRRESARRVLDVIGNSLAAKDQAATEVVRNVVLAWEGPADSFAIGAGKLPAAAAALLNGTLAHAMDFDDTHLPSVLHPSASVVPAALAVGAKLKSKPTDVMDAIAFGIEVTCRLGMAGYNKKLGNSVFFERGLHATSICGTLGAATAAAMLYKLSAAQITSAIGIASSMGAGLLEANRTGGTVKRMHCGWAAHGGVVAAELAKAGLTGPPTVIEGRFGFMQAYCGDQVNLAELTDDLGTSWVLPGLFFKPYPCNHFTHTGIDAARKMKANGITPDQIERLELGVPTPVLRTIAEPREAKIKPESGYHAAFSGPYTIAAAFYRDHGLGLFHEDFEDEAAHDPEILALAAKVNVSANASCDEIFPHQFPAVLTAYLKDGSSVTEQVLVNRGGPQDPLSDAELALKFESNARLAISSAQAAKIAQSIFGFATNSSSLDQLAQLLEG
ncbi:MAG: MmgE/PrpD family protein [Actinomycetota bacterium]|nr:MmgE/PrpD family protein [Actinomycetota bacterium]